MKECYKVVSVDENYEFYSVNVINHPKFRVQYSQSFFTEASVGGLLVFDSLERAIRFAKKEVSAKNNHIAVFRANGYEEVKGGVFSELVFNESVPEDIFLKKIEDCWNSCMCPDYLFNFPSGSMAFKKVILNDYMGSFTYNMIKNLL